MKFNRVATLSVLAAVAATGLAGCQSASKALGMSKVVPDEFRVVEKLPRNPLGKVHRINDDGSIPSDNPFVNTPGAVPSIWTYGHRNPEGLAWEPGTGALWESEHGPTNGDEVNLLIKGHNYGWGVVSKGSQGGITLTSAPGMDDPIVYYTPTLAPAGMTFYTGSKFPKWKNNLFVTSMIVGRIAGTGQYSLLVSGESPLAFDEFAFVELSGRGGHQGYYPIIGLPQVGKTVKAVARFSGLPQSVRFEFRDLNGQLISSFNLGDKDVEAFRMSGDVLVPSQSFRVYALGADSGGAAFQRLLATVIFPQRVTVNPP